MFKPSIAFQETINAAPLVVAAVSSPDSVRALVHGLFQLAPDDRMTCGAAMDHPFFATKLAPIVSSVAAGRGCFSVMQGELEPQLVQWLRTDPYWTDIVSNMNMLKDQAPFKKRKRGIAASVDWTRIFEEGGYMGCEPPSVSKCGLIDCSTALSAGRVVAFVRAFKRKNYKWLQELGQACRKDLAEKARDIVSPYLDRLFRDCAADTAFSYGLIQVYKAFEYRDNEHFHGDAFSFCAV